MRTGIVLYVRYTSTSSSNPNSTRRIKVLDEFPQKEDDGSAGGKFRVTVYGPEGEVERHYVVGNTSHISWKPFSG